MELLTISWAGAFTVIGSVVAFVVGVLSLAKSFNNKTPIDHSVDIKSLKDELDELERKVSSLQGSLDGKVDTQIVSIHTQIDDLKSSISRLQDKLEKLTDLIIKHFSTK